MPLRDHGSPIGGTINVMRSLLMLRHAKSDWNADYGGEDLLRPLTERGRRAARTVGRFLSAMGEVPDRAITSPAQRAQQTVGLVREAAGSDFPVATSDGLYGGPDEVLGAVHGVGRETGLLLIVGHEPAWSAVASRLANGADFLLPTASLLRLDLEAEDWAAVEGDGRIRWFVTPRLLERASLAGPGAGRSKPGRPRP
jgi:phosphohistidine phosphatase